MLELIILRHALSIGNKDKIIQGHIDLDPIERKVPSSLMKAIGKYGTPTAIYTTDLKRGKYPAEDLHKRIQATTDSPIYFEATEQLRERNLGIYEGQPYKVIAEDTKKLTQQTYSMAEIQNGESRTQATKRAAHCINRITETEQSGLLILVSHITFINYIMDYLEQKQSPAQLRFIHNLQGFYCKLDKDYKALHVEKFTGS